MKNARNVLTLNLVLIILVMFTCQFSHAQQVEVQGELKVTEMNSNEDQENLVIRNADGTLGTRSVNSLPPPAPPIDTTRNLASDFELAKALCDCPNLPPFMINKLLESGYTPEELVASGIAVQNVIDAQRGGILIDRRDNQSYKTVTIGSQTWMAENLNFGTRINGMQDQLNNNIIEKYCNDDLESNCDTYGGLYQWDEMMQYVAVLGTQGICPDGWHLPSDNEWKTLEIELGMTLTETDMLGFRGTNQGSQMATFAYLWQDGALEENGTFGSSGIGSLPAGVRITGGLFSALSQNSYFWTSSAVDGNGWLRRLDYNNTKVTRNLFSKFYGCSVRCVKD